MLSNYKIMQKEFKLQTLRTKVKFTNHLTIDYINTFFFGFPSELLNKSEIFSMKPSTPKESFEPNSLTNYFMHLHPILLTL